MNIALLALMLPTASEAAMWYVTCDPGQPEDRVGAVAGQAAPGDTIIIAPGIYYEHIQLEGKSLTFTGSAGAGETILDGSREFAGRAGSIIYTLTGQRARLHLQGLTFRNGTGAPWSEEGGTIGGGAVFWWNNTWSTAAGASLTVAECVFENNSTGGPENGWAAGGGAIFACRLEGTDVRRCGFSHNTSHTKGGDILCVWGQHNVVAQCTFDVTAGSWNGAASIHHEGYDLTISECSFEADEGGGTGQSEQWAVYSNPTQIEILNCRFNDRAAIPLATRVMILYSGVERGAKAGSGTAVHVSRCVFWNSAGPDSAGPTALLLGIPDGEFTVSENTFVRCGIAAGNDQTGFPMVFERNIIARGRVELDIPNGGRASCNAIWRTPVSGHHQNVVFVNNLSEPPLFCNEPAGDLTIATNSPCAPEHTPAGCGGIGALDPACTGSAVRQVTWGRIKSLFR